MLEVVIRFQAAAGHEHISDADSGCTAKCRASVKLIIPLQEGTVNDVENVFPVVVPVFVCQLRGNLLQLAREAALPGNIESLLQSRRYCVPVFFPVLPKVRIQAIVHAACVGDIEHIAQNRPAPAVVNEGDTSGAAPDVPAHSLVPEVVLRAGGSVRPLGVNHQLFREGIFLKMLSRGNVRFILIEACSLSFPLLVSRLSCRAQGTATVTVLILILQVGTIQPLEYLYLQQVTAGPDGFGILFPLKTSGFSF